MLKTIGVLLLLGLVAAQDETSTKYPYHPHKHLEDYFHEIEGIDDSNRIIDEIVKHSYLQLETSQADMPDISVDISDILPEGQLTLKEGSLRGLKVARRRGNSQYYQDGADITVKSVIEFPELRIVYDEAEIQAVHGVQMEAQLKMKYLNLRVEMAVAHHETEHSNKVVQFKILDYDGTSYFFLARQTTGRLVTVSTGSLRRKMEGKIIQAVEDVLRKTAEAHILAWR